MFSAPMFLNFDIKSQVIVHDPLEQFNYFGLFASYEKPSEYYCESSYTIIKIVYNFTFMLDYLFKTVYNVCCS